MNTTTGRGRPALTTPLRAQRERLYNVMRRATDLTASDVPDDVCNARLRSPAWKRHNAIMAEAYDCRDPERLRSLLNQATAALDAVEHGEARAFPWLAVLVAVAAAAVALAWVLL